MPEKIMDYSDRKQSLEEMSDDETSHLLDSSTKHESYGPTVSQPGLQDDQSEEVVVEVEVVRGTQSSIVTIFAMWNTMMGTSLLSMPWAVKQAGYVNGIIFLLVMAGLMAYTSYRVLHAGRSLATSVLMEFSYVVRVYLGRFFEATTVVCSLLTLLGGCIVYWILMSNFLYHIGVFIKSQTGNGNSNATFFDPLASFAEVTCDNQTAIIHHKETMFDKVWDETDTVPFFLVLLLFPLINFKSPTFFTKFNSLGTLSVAYLVVFVCVKASQWGFHIDFDSNHSDQPDYTPMFQWSFPALTGISALAYFVQNSITAIASNQKNPENNTRDLLIAYTLVCVTYTFMGAIFYAAFPLEKSCIEDNFLNNIASDDVMAFVARIGLFFQMTCVFPLLAYIIRSQLLQFLFHSVWPSTVHVVVLNILIVSVGVVFAVFMPKIGHIISFVGAFCGFSYAIALPCAVYIVACRADGNLTYFKLIFHCFLILVGFMNFVAQFIIIGHTQ